MAEAFGAQDNLSGKDGGDGHGAEGADAAILEHGMELVAGFIAAEGIGDVGQAVPMQAPSQPEQGDNVEPGGKPRMRGRKGYKQGRQEGNHCDNGSGKGVKGHGPGQNRSRDNAGRSQAREKGEGR